MPVSAEEKLLRTLFAAPPSTHLQTTAGGILAMQHLFFQYYLQRVRETGKNQFLSIATDERPMLHALEQMEMIGCGVKLLPVDKDGRVIVAALEHAIGPKTALLSFSAVCALTGSVQPIAEIIEICKARGVQVHINATQAIGSWGVSLQEWDVDYLTFDGSRGGGIFSKDVVIVDAGLWQPLTQEVAALVQGQEQFAMEAARLRRTFEEEVVRAIPDTIILRKEVERAPHLFSLAFPGLTGEALMYLLHRHNIEASIGGGKYPLLKELAKEDGYHAISLSIPRHLQQDVLANTLDKLVQTVRKLKTMSAHLD